MAGFDQLTLVVGICQLSNCPSRVLEVANGWIQTGDLKCGYRQISQLKHCSTYRRLYSNCRPQISKRHSSNCCATDCSSKALLRHCFYSFTVRQAQLVGPQAYQVNAYVALKLQNVKSTTLPLKGPQPCWEQDFLL